MKRQFQFSLPYLFLETFWIAAALGCFTQVLRVPGELQAVLLVYGWLCSGVAIGGLFGRMSAGFLAALGLIAAGGVAMLVLIAGLALVN